MTPQHRPWRLSSQVLVVSPCHTWESSPGPASSLPAWSPSPVASPPRLRCVCCSWLVLSCLSGSRTPGSCWVASPSSVPTATPHCPQGQSKPPPPPTTKSLGLEAPTWPVNCSPHSASEALPRSGALPSHVPAPPKLPPPVTQHTQVLAPPSRPWKPGRAQSKCPAGV